MPSKGIRSFDPANLCQIAIVVKSIDETVKFYTEVFGMGPFEIRNVEIPPPPITVESGLPGQAGFRPTGTGNPRTH